MIFPLVAARGKGVKSVGGKSVVAWEKCSHSVRIFMCI